MYKKIRFLAAIVAHARIHTPSNAILHQAETRRATKDSEFDHGNQAFLVAFLQLVILGKRQGKHEHPIE